MEFSMNIFKIKIGSKATSKVVGFSIIEEDPERAIAIAINLAKNEFPCDDSLCSVDIVLVEKKSDKTLN
jgi:hypothetical protein